MRVTEMTLMSSSWPNSARRWRLLTQTLRRPQQFVHPLESEQLSIRVRGLGDAVRHQHQPVALGSA